MNEKTDSAVTAAELDELERRLNAGGYYLTEKPTHLEAGVALASLRKQLDEAREREARLTHYGEARQRVLVKRYKQLDEARADNAKKDAALREAIEFADQDVQALTPAGEAMVARWKAALTLASQEALASSHAEWVADVCSKATERQRAHTASIPLVAPASPSPGLREQIAENANCSGLREAVIEECAKVARDHAATWGLAMGAPAIVIAEAIEALLSRPVSEREGAATAPAPAIIGGDRVLLREALTELQHAEVFVTSREKMHPDGVTLYREVMDRIDDALAAADRSAS